MALGNIPKTFAETTTFTDPTPAAKTFQERSLGRTAYIHTIYRTKHPYSLLASAPTYPNAIQLPCVKIPNGNR
ncbi:unnamed protein product [Tuber melanosporum]|uniref:(Perigord truffle) hypothetical protein n=1 Tax=Tuber melanosporum (strain Mel28) TaxID=656061 RepID=D5G8N4_TUBMM|nr:uncharacterized protein GSTUM_00003030001 [Tuber melanosporum]CAZ80877.1 unnamed protein product [Tuber melanosporum]